MKRLISFILVCITLFAYPMFNFIAINKSTPNESDGVSDGIAALELYGSVDVADAEKAVKKSAEENAEMYLELLPFARECGVKIATENMWDWDYENDHAVPSACATPEDFNAHLDAVNDDFFVACLDIGHAEMKGLNTSSVEMIKALGPRLKALHIHDNDKWHDSHQIPFSMDVNFEEIVRALKDINYDGYFTLETVPYMKDYTAENAIEGVKNLARSAKKLADMFESLK